ncbi:hypothetical protein ISN44_As02g011590 [Arabidopsis suecica]|uniref:Uncharacterized protein n=1 Tax=Arabidopsis suecica TaxID=45249 RepID=A0A8T2G2W5_ARASU|nr:hypothetical protein ISN44_As02g011590 [Arabidopsis suecica]
MRFSRYAIYGSRGPRESWHSLKFLMALGFQNV